MGFLDAALGYIILLYYGFLYFAVYSFAYYAVQSRASTEIIDRFVDSLQAPFSWLFWGKKSQVSRILLKKSQKSMEAYFQTVSIAKIQTQRRYSAAIASILMIVFSIGLIRLWNVMPGLEVLNYLFWIILNTLTWIACFRFGSKLLHMS